MRRAIPWFLPFGAMVVSLITVTIVMGERTATSEDPELEALIEPDVVIVMKDKMFHVMKGGDKDDDPMFAVEAGFDTMITLHNEDDVAHEFVSPFFMNVEVMISGEATTVFTENKNAVGFRVEGGKSVTIRFLAPHVNTGFKIRKDLFWCNVHGKNTEDKMRGELMLMETKRYIP